MVSVALEQYLASADNVPPMLSFMVCLNETGVPPVPPMLCLIWLLVE